LVDICQKSWVPFRKPIAFWKLGSLSIARQPKGFSVEELVVETMPIFEHECFKGSSDPGGDVIEKAAGE
jgi:hypothetical protein